MGEAPALVRQLARALVEGQPIDWPSAFRLARDERDLAQARHLQSVASLARQFQREATPDAADHRSFAPALLECLVLALAATHASAAAVTFLWLGFDAWTGFLPAQFGILLAFGMTALVLLVGERADQRAFALGAFYLLVAAALSRPLLRHATAHPLLGWTSGLWHGWYTEAFIGAAAWRFARAFPSTLRFTVVDRIAHRAGAAALVAGAALFALNAALAWLPSDTLPPWLGAFHRDDTRARFWDVTDLMLFGALLTIGVRTVLAPADERRRVAWVGAAVALGFAPLLGAAVLAVGWPESNAAWRASAPSRLTIDTAVIGGLLLTPAITAYAVLARRVFTIRVVLRRALQYLLARYTLTAAIVVPAVWIAAQAYALRAQPLSAIAADAAVRRAAWACLVAIVLLTGRTWLLRGLERLFVGRRLAVLDRLPRFAEQVGSARTPREAAAATVQELRDSLGLEPAAVLLRGSAGWRPLVGDLPPLPADGALESIVPADSVMALAPHQRLYRALPLQDRRWLDEARVESAVALATPAGGAIGLLVAGPRRNGFPLSDDDAAFLVTIARTLSLALDLRGQHPTPLEGVPGESDEVASECLVCGSVQAAPGVCECGNRRTLARLPPRLGDRFALVRSLGRGGMGVVYLGRDLRLGRLVALKTLPVLQRDAADALRAEARAMAAVEHASLAQIYGMEIWRRTPVLVTEYLPNGTLATALQDGPLDVSRASEIAIALAEALAALHDNGMLHRDIKPSNIAFNRSGNPKLLDFGLARLLERGAGEASTAAAFRVDTPATLTSAVAGTPLYLSPEALAGAPPDVRRDLWALGLVLFEAVAGVHPFRAATVGEVLARVREGAARDPRLWSANVPEAMVTFFRRALHVDAARRFSTAREFRAALLALPAMTSDAG